MSEEVFVRRAGGSVMRVRVVRRDAARRLRLARRLAGLGWGVSRIAQACQLPPRAVIRALQAPVGGLWGAHAATLRRELAGV